MPTPAHKRTAERAAYVRSMTGFGAKADDISRVMKISGPTLRKYYRSELDTGAIEANAKVAEALFKKAIGNGPASVTACIFWLKTRAQWKETSVHEHIGADGGPIELTDARAELMRLVERQQAIPVAEASDAASESNGSPGSNGSQNGNGHGRSSPRRRPKP